MMVSSNGPPRWQDWDYAVSGMAGGTGFDVGGIGAGDEAVCSRIDVGDRGFLNEAEGQQ